MGRKYASIHIFTDEPDRVLSVLERYYNQEDSLGTTIRQVREIVKNTAALKMIEEALRASQKILVVQSGSFVSIYDGWLGFETVEEKAQALSCIIDRPVVYTSNFDDDIFVFGVFRLGERVTGGNAGQGLPVYGIAPETIDIGRFREELAIKETGAIERINALDEIDAIENEIEQWLQVPLKITIPDVRSDSEHYVKRSAKGRVHVYRRL